MKRVDASSSSVPRSGLRAARRPALARAPLSAVPRFLWGRADGPDHRRGAGWGAALERFNDTNPSSPSISALSRATGWRPRTSLSSKGTGRVRSRTASSTSRSPTRSSSTFRPNARRLSPLRCVGSQSGISCKRQTGTSDRASLSSAVLPVPSRARSAGTEPPVHSRLARQGPLGADHLSAKDMRGLFPTRRSSESGSADQEPDGRTRLSVSGTPRRRRQALAPADADFARCPSRERTSGRLGRSHLLRLSSADRVCPGRGTRAARGGPSSCTSRSSRRCSDR